MVSSAYLAEELLGPRQVRGCLQPLECGARRLSFQPRALTVAAHRQRLRQP
jgi:hypothetical protein